MKGICHEATAETINAPEVLTQDSNSPRPILPEHIRQARQQCDGFTVQRPDPALRRDLAHGWMLPMLLTLDACLWRRWDYWRDCMEAADALPPEPIPRVELLATPHPGTRRMLEASLDCIPQHGGWQTWSGWSYFTYLLDWLLFGFGHKGQPEPPAEPAGCHGASNRLYQVFALDAMLLWPHDYFGSLLAESSYGKQQGFYPTPHHICEFMTRMACGRATDREQERDLRLETVCDPCVGTGRFLLHASNHSLRLYGCEIDLTLCKATLVNGYCYIPWLVRPIPRLDGELAALERLAPDDGATYGQSAQALSDLIAAAAPPQAQQRVRGTEHDPHGQRQVAPLLKRKKQAAPDPTQGSLF